MVTSVILPKKGIAAAFAVAAAVIGVVCVTTAETATFTVNSSSDAPDANPGDGVCASSAGVCTLRAAIEEANALAGRDTINIPAGIYTVTSRIQIKDSIDLLGESASTTIISGGSAQPIFQVMPRVTGPGPTVTIQRLTLRDGSTAFADSGAAL
jgi:CSLREA domain-containing protein